MSGKKPRRKKDASDAPEVQSADAPAVPDAMADLWPRIVDRPDYDPGYKADGPIECDICGGIMSYTAQCKIVCGTCGYMRDCSDP